MTLQPHHVFFLCALALFALLYVSNPVAKQSGSKPNVIVIALDGVQARHLSAYGYERQTTPHVDALLEHSYVFKRAISPSSWTVPTYMSMFTSLHPSQHKLTNKLVEIRTATGTAIVSASVDALKPGIVRLAEVLKQNGYQTAAFTGDAGLSSVYGYGAGFDLYFETAAFGSLRDTHAKALEWLDTLDQKPFFMLVHGYDAHGQHVVEGGLDYRYVQKPYTGVFTGSTAEQKLLRERGLRGEKITLSPDSIAYWRAIYDEKINNADRWLGSFIQELKRRDLYKDALIVVVSDHGTEVYEHTKFDHGHTLYGELLDVLFAIKLPNQQTSHEVHSLVSTLDLAPTLLSLLHIRDPRMEQQQQGIDLSQSFDGSDISRPIFSETDYRLYTHKRSVTTPDGWKYIVTRETGAAELYNLTDDPRELINVQSTQTAKARELDALLEKHFISLGDTGPWPLGCLAVYGDQCQ